ncbi:hypothetical protein [Virgibacillus sp. MSJ-26]|nr:hypothetical protein [Virgibacillus sp. MSJ-26]
MRLRFIIAPIQLNCTIGHERRELLKPCPIERSYWTLNTKLT